MTDEWRDIPNVWGGIGPKLREITWPVQGQSNAPSNLYDWLLANNRYPQHRGRSAALAFIKEQAARIKSLEEQIRAMAPAGGAGQ